MKVVLTEAERITKVHEDTFEGYGDVHYIDVMVFTCVALMFIKLRI